MARYKALRKGYPDKQVEVDEQFDWDGPPGSWMEPICEEAKQRFAARFGADAKPKGGIEDRRPMGSAPAGPKATSPDMAAHIARLEALVATLSQAASDSGKPAARADAKDAVGSGDTPPGDKELTPELAAALERRRGRAKDS